jgi:zinc transport system ATP-binding protein
MANALEVEALSVRFGDAVVLRDLSFVVATGASLAIIGPNGAGKTVLFRALIGSLPAEGRIRWAPGTRVGYVPQKLDIERGLPLTGDDFLRAKASVTRATRSEVAEAVKAVRLDAATSRRSLGALSGGQFQRLLVAAALIGRPNVLLLDEPTAGVDESGQETLYETINRLHRDQRLTTLLISHDLSVVYRYASEVLCLSHGRACCGAPRSVLTPALLEELYGAPLGYHVHDEPRP